MPTIFTNIANARDLPRGTQVAFVYKGTFRMGKIESCNHPTLITIQTGDPIKPYKSFKRAEIENSVPC